MGAQGIYGKLGLGKETAFGTGVDPTVFIPGTENIVINIPRDRDQQPNTGRAPLAAETGRIEIAGTTNGMRAYPRGIGHLLRAALGDPATSGTGPYTHVFDMPTGPISDQQALPSYSITRKAGSSVRRYAGGQLNSLTLNAPADGPVTFDADWLFMDFVDGVTDPTVVLENASPFRCADAAHKRAGAAFPYIESLTITLANNLEAEGLQDGTCKPAAILLGPALLTVNMTLAFNSPNVYDDFKNNAPQAWEFAWVKAGGDTLKIEVPKLNIESYPDPLSATGRLTVNVTGTAELDPGVGYPFRVTLINGEASY